MVLKFADFNLSPPPNDPVSSLNFSPFDAQDAQDAQDSQSRTYNLLVSSWDKHLKVYKVQIQSTNSPDQQEQTNCEIINDFQAEAPTLDSCWINQDLVASGGIDRRVRIHNLKNNQSKIIGKHRAPISRIRFHSKTNLLFTTSWDSTFSIWNLEDKDSLFSESNERGEDLLLYNVELPDKVLAMDLSPPSSSSEDDSRIIIGMTGRNIHIYKVLELEKITKELYQRRTEIENSHQNEDQKEKLKEELEKFRNENRDNGVIKPEQRRESSLKFMLRDIKAVPDGHGYATSSVEGRIAVEFFDPSPSVQEKKYAFKCHRQNIEGIDTVYPVNCIVFHQIHGTFLSLGGDSVVSIWDALAKKRIKQFVKFESPLSFGAISWDGMIMCLATGAENIEDTRHVGVGAGEVGGIGQGGEGKIKLIVKPAWEDCLPKSKANAPPSAPTTS